MRYTSIVLAALLSCASAEAVPTSAPATTDTFEVADAARNGNVSEIFDGKIRAAEVMASAIEYSTRGLSLIVVLGANDSLDDFRTGLTRLMTDLLADNVPVQLFGLRGAKPESYAYMILDGRAYGRAPYNTADYDLTDAAPLRADAASLYRMTRDERLALLEVRDRERQAKVRIIDAEIAELHRKLAENEKAQRQEQAVRP